MNRQIEDKEEYKFSERERENLTPSMQHVERRLITTPLSINERFYEETASPTIIYPLLLFNEGRYGFRSTGTWN